MIDYGFLCQAIADWREGKRPDAPPPAAHAMHAVQAVVATTSDSIEYEEVQDFEEASEIEYDNYGSEFGGTGADRTQSYVPGGMSGSPDYIPRTGTPVAGVQVAPEQADDVDVDVADDDDFQRDYDLEEIDDFADFDPTADLKGWFVARMRIEQAWEDRKARTKLFREFGIRDQQHFYQVQATMDRYVQSEDAQDRYGGMDAIMQLQMNAHMDAAMGQMQARAQGELAGELAPFEGVSLQQWAGAQAKVAGGGDVDAIIRDLGIDRAKWDRVSAEWNARMSRDTTATIAMEYGKAFSGAGQGMYGGAAAAGAGAMTPGGDVDGEPPIPFEQWVELEVAQSKGVEQGRDANDILKSFGLNALAWSNASAWWSVYFNRHAMEDGQALLHEYNELRDRFEAQYSAGKADDDIDF